MLDQVFGENNFQNEIVWKRTGAHNDSKQGSKHFGRIHDSIFLFTKSQTGYTWNQIYLKHSDSYIYSHYRQIDADGRRYMWDNLTGPGGAAKGNAYYEVLGVSGFWRYKQETMEQLIAEGRVGIPPKGKTPRFKRYLDEQKGVPVQSVWDDLSPVNSQAKEAIGFPTQKPIPLLERIITASSNPDDVILDAFCGCGTALVAAQRLERRWIGIDISPTACRVIADRLEKTCGLSLGKDFLLRDMPHTEAFLRRIPHFEFENWAVIALGGTPNAAKVGDKGIDGRIYPISAMPSKDGQDNGRFDFMNHWFPIQVKQKDKAGRPDIDSFEAVMMREDKPKGFFVSFDYTQDAESEVRAFFRRTGKEIIPVKVGQILSGDIPLSLSR